MLLASLVKTPTTPAAPDAVPTRAHATRARRPSAIEDADSSILEGTGAGFSGVSELTYLILAQ